MTSGSILVAVALVAIALAAAFGAGAWLGHVLTRRRWREDGYLDGHRAGYDAMLREHNEYRERNRALLRTIQNLTPDDPGTIDAGAQPPGTFDTSGGYDVHRETERGAQAVARAPTLEGARGKAEVYLTTAGAHVRELVVTKPGPDGPRIEVERVRRGPDGLLIAATITPDGIGPPAERYAPPPPPVGVR